ncbi:MAG: hypothetical protein WD314_00420 [Trueperaceae bacterium]
MLAVLEEHRKRQEAELEYLGESYQDKGLVFSTSIGTEHPRNLLRDFYRLQELTVTAGDWTRA